jgi:hypothetical protein
MDGPIAGSKWGVTLGDSPDSPVGQVDVDYADTILYFHTLSFFMSTPKRSGACMRCGQHYIDLLDHIKRNTETTSSPAGTLRTPPWLYAPAAGLYSIMPD